MTTTTAAKDIAKARADEAEAVAAAYVVQLRKRELDLANNPTHENYRRVAEARAQTNAARRHLKNAAKEYKQCR